MSRQILIVPSVKKGRGSGHLVRSLKMAQKDPLSCTVFIKPSNLNYTLEEITIAFPDLVKGLIIKNQLEENDIYDLVLLDSFKMSSEEALAFQKHGPIIALDLDGSARNACVYVLDTLPNLCVHRANVSSKRFLSLPNIPKVITSYPKSIKKILITFGGEDNLGLGEKVARFLVEKEIFKESEITLIANPLHVKSNALINNRVKFVSPIPNLKDHLLEWDLVLTQFGLSAFEAVNAKRYTVLFNSSRYHVALSKKAKFPVSYFKVPLYFSQKSFENKVLHSIQALESLYEGSSESILDFLNSMNKIEPCICRACKSKNISVFARSENKTYIRCNACNMISLIPIIVKEKIYSEDYFFAEYKAQYGKTYLEDFDHLSTMARERLARIEKMLPLARTEKIKTLASANVESRVFAELSVLDIGCAYGAFLKVCKENGFTVYGLDIAESAVSYVKENITNNAYTSAFPNKIPQELENKKFTIVTLWYVIEHFDDLNKVFTVLQHIVAPNGVLAISTPSGEGVSARFNKALFFQKSPDDHFTVFRPSKIKKLLASFGFTKVRIVSTGHHPERFFPTLKLKKGDILYSFFMIISKLCKLGDTFELYAKKQN